MIETVAKSGPREGELPVSQHDLSLEPKSGNEYLVQTVVPCCEILVVDCWKVLDQKRA